MGNIDWRALLNLWSVLDYLTKYNAKAGQGSKHLAKLLEDVIEIIYKYEVEDGIHDLWRRTVMKFYNKILGDRDYSLLEVTHFVLKLPATLSSFPEVQGVSVSSWAALKAPHVIRKMGLKSRVTHLTKIELFSQRHELARPKSIHDSDLTNLSFYAFWRMFDVQKQRLVRRQREKIISITGCGWPSHANQNSPHHEEYARKTLYAYMPCLDLQGVEFIDACVQDNFSNSWKLALEMFVKDPSNIWCPPWIRRN